VLSYIIRSESIDRPDTRPVAEITEINLQQFLNEHVAAGASRSKLSKLLLTCATFSITPS